MTPLQEAAKAARNVVPLPTCKACNGYGKDTFIHVATCRECGGCGVDTSNSYALIGRVMVWFMIDVTKTAVTTTGIGYLAHDGTPEGLATALLEVVARHSMATLPP